MINWFKELFSKAARIFRDFIAAAIPAILQLFIAAMKEYTISVVLELSKTDLTNAEKRNQAAEWIKAEAIRKAIKFKDSWINLLIELVVSMLKNQGLM